MNDAEFASLAGWIAAAGLASEDETALVAGYCDRLIRLGVPLARASVVVDTLHPTYEGRVFSWRANVQEPKLTEYERIGDNTELADRWRRSPFYRLLETGESVLRRQLVPATAEGANEFPIFDDLRNDGMTDYIAIINRFAGVRTISEMDCAYSSWMSDAPQGFQDGDIDALIRSVPLLALAVKSASLARVAATLVETYLGRDAGRRVLSGRILRGVADRIAAVLWMSDLVGYTPISEKAPPDEIIPFLNDYAEAVFTAIHNNGGDVLKLMADGTLAIFTADQPEDACRAALAAYEETRIAITALNRQRSEKGQLTTDMYLGLHFGDVFYGNIGSKDRLDFTIVGPAVNEVSRIAAMCRSIDQPILVSSAFAGALGDGDNRLVSVGRYALRGVKRPQTLYTLDMGES